MRKIIQMILDFFMKKKTTTTSKTTTKTSVESASKPTTQVKVENKTQISSSSQKKQTMNRNCYALMVGIDKYAYPVPALKGCVNDRDALKDYLERQFAGQKDVQLNIKTLTDSEATKQNVIQGFDFYKQAKPGDICLFYYSGHGAPSPAPIEFWHLDPDGMSEGLVCYDSRNGARDLMDKEISYLIAKATEGKEVHFIALFDCCHSGTITRDATFTARTTSAPPYPIKFEEYFGHEEYRRVTSADGKTLIYPPVGKYIQLAACREQETAKETMINNNTRGIFTYSLIEALEQNGGALSYADLVHVLQVRLANKVRDQLPQLITINPEDKNQRFLGGSIPDKANYSIDFQQNKWIVNAGSLQGIPAEGGQLQLEDGSTVTISSVGANTSEVRGMESKDPNQSYKAFAKGLNFKKVKIAFAPNTTNDGVRVVSTAWKDVLSPYMEIINNPTDAQYWIRYVDKSFQLTLPGDTRPLFKRVENPNHVNAVAFLNAAEKVAKWHNLLELSNPKSTIKENEFAIDLYRITDPGNYEDSAPAELVDWKQSNVFRYEKKNGEWQQPAFRIKVRNTGNRTLYLSALNLMDNFAVTNRFLSWQELAPGKEAWLLDVFEGNNYQTIPLSVDNAAYESYGINEVKEYFKIIISNDKSLNTDRYEQEGLELDIKPETVVKRAGRESQNKPETLDWTTADIEMIVVRPMEQQPLEGGRTVALMNALKITAPQGVSAKISLTSLPEAERSLSTSDTNPDMHFMPQMSRSADYVAEAFQFTNGRNTSPGLSVLELHDVQGADQLSTDNPLKVDLQRGIEANEMVIPMGYDPVTKLYFPLGFTDSNGQVSIAALPEPSAVNTRSLGSAVKIFFQKVVLNKLGFDYKYPQLAIAEFQPQSEEFQYKTDLEEVKKAVANAKNIVVFIHGIIGDTTVMPKMLPRIAQLEGQKNPYDLALTFDYENLNTDIRQTAKDLKAKLEAVGLTAGHSKKLTIVAHSMGGLVARWLIEKEGGNELVARLIQVGTPNMGSPWSDVYQLSTALLTKVVNGAAFLQPYLFSLNLLGKFAGKAFITLQQMDPDDSDFLKELNSGTDPKCHYTIVAGNTQLIPKAIQEVQKSILQRSLAAFNKQNSFKLLDQFLFKVPNDIAVAVNSIYGIPGSDKWQNPPKIFTVGCDHISYFGDPEGLKVLATAIQEA